VISARLSLMIEDLLRNTWFYCIRIESRCDSYVM